MSVPCSDHAVLLKATVQHRHLETACGLSTHCMDLETVLGLCGRLAVGKNINVPAFVAVFSVLHYTNLNGISFSLEYCGVEPKDEAVPPSGSHYMPQHQFLCWSWTRLCTRLGPL